MTVTTANKVTISRAEFLESFVQLYHAIKDYEELVYLFSSGESLQPQEIKAIVQDRMNHLEFGSVNVRAMEIIGTYLRHTLEKYKGEQLTFLIPDAPNDEFFAINDGYLDLSRNIQKIEEDLREIEEKVYYVSRLLPPQNVDKIRLLLKAISSFFKSIVRKDIEDMDSHINHMHHLTASKESYFVINDIGRMVRDIYNSLQDFSSHVPVEELEPNIVDEMPDAIDKLNLVIKRMEDSANSTLDDVENLLEQHSTKVVVNSTLIEECHSMEKKLQAIKESHPDAGDAIDDVISDLKTNLLEQLSDRSQMMKEEETVYFDIISNQSFQDITGQTLKKIITFIEQLEFNLLQILQKYSGKIKAATQPASKNTPLSPLVGVETNDGIVLHGPRDNQPTEAEVNKQEDVDKMLAEFGF